MIHNSIESVRCTNTPFRIVFSDDPVCDLEDEENASMGILVLGAHTEHFVADLSFWTKEQYRSQWFSALEHILDKEECDALIVSMHDPNRAKFIEWWPMWREAEAIVFHNQLLFLDKLNHPLDLSDLAKHIGARRSINDEGVEVSEWRIPVDAIRDFVARERAD